MLNDYGVPEVMIAFDDFLLIGIVEFFSFVFKFCKNISSFP